MYRGSNSKENLVRISARVHFLLHWILCKIYPNNYKISSAFNKMCQIDKNQICRIINSKNFQYARLNFSKNHPLKDLKIKEKHLMKCEESKQRACFSRNNNKLEKLNNEGIFPLCELDEEYFNIPYNKKIKFKDGTPAASKRKSNNDRVYCTENWISKLNEQELELYKIRKSSESKKYLSELSVEEMTNRMKNSFGSCDSIKRGIAISNAKKGKPTNQQEIMGRRYALMDKEQFILYISFMKTERMKTRSINLRNKWKSILNLS